MNVEKEIQRFKMELLRKMPFYGDILMHLTFVADKKIQTAATDGKTIWYSPHFLSELQPGERNFVLMHEVFHVMLRHGVRNADGKRDKDVWNTACDIIVNNMLEKLHWNMRSADIPFQKPKVGIFANISSGETAENLYAKIKADNGNRSRAGLKMIIRNGYIGNRVYEQKQHEVDVPSDIRTFELSAEELEIRDRQLQEIIRTAAHKSRGTMGSYYIPVEVYSLTDSKKLDWRGLLKNFLSQEIGDDASYSTPERKYLHMDLILPGHCMTEEIVEEIWAFIDSSGSVGHDAIAEFLTQLYRIGREFKCIFNICYWDTAVTEVYKNIRREADILKCIPHHSGGTDINCVYQWIQDNRVKPDVMLILTDGYFGKLTTSAFKQSFGKKTILVLNSDVMINADMKRIGKIAKL